MSPVRFSTIWLNGLGSQLNVDILHLALKRASRLIQCLMSVPDLKLVLVIELRKFTFNHLILWESKVSSACLWWFCLARRICYTTSKTKMRRPGQGMFHSIRLVPPNNYYLQLLLRCFSFLIRSGVGTKTFTPAPQTEGCLFVVYSVFLPGGARHGDFRLLGSGGP